MKKTYIIPVLNIVKINVENIIATSGPDISDKPANQSAGMDVKEQSSVSYDVWDDDWSR